MRDELDLTGTGYGACTVVHSKPRHHSIPPRWKISGVVVVHDGDFRGSGRADALRLQTERAEAFHIPDQNIRVLMPDSASEYRGKHT